MSIINNEKRCRICGTKLLLHIHHVIFGSKRKLADEDGLVVHLCPNCHHRVHTDPNFKPIGMDITWQLYLKQEGQECWERVYGNRDKFIERYGRSYL